MTELQAIEKDIETCNQMIKEAAELDKALGSKHGKLIMKLLTDGKEDAAKLTVDANETLAKQGLLGVQAVVWVEKHFDYQKQLASHAASQLEQLEEAKAAILADVE